jgi:hypothetical protein
VKRVCVDCGLGRPIRQGTHGKRCNDCRKARNKLLTAEWFARQPLEYKEEKKRQARDAAKKRRATNREPEIRKSLKRKYGITLENFKAMYAAQNGLCAICKVPLPDLLASGRERKRVHVDHCHESKVVRGLLCNVCNLGIGLFRNSPLNLFAAANYLSSF